MEITPVMPKGELPSPIVSHVREGWWGKVKDFVSVDVRTQKKVEQYNTLLDTLPPNVSAEERVRIGLKLAKRAKNVAVLGVVMDGLAVGGVVTAAVVGVKLAREGHKKVVHFKNRVPAGTKISDLVTMAANRPLANIAIETMRLTHDVSARAAEISIRMVGWPFGLGRAHVPRAEETWAHGYMGKQWQKITEAKVMDAARNLEIHHKTSIPDATRFVKEEVRKAFDQTSSNKVARKTLLDVLGRMKKFSK